MITGEYFDTTDTECNIQPFVMENICREMKRNKQLLETVLSAMVQDTECVNVIAMAVMNCRASDIGISAPGTIAEFFLRSRSKKPKQDSHKVSKKTRKAN